MNIIFIGSSGPLSLIPLNFLLQSEHELCAIAYEANSKVSYNGTKYPIIASENESVEMLARMAGLPAIQLFDNNDEYIDAIKAYKPDVIIVSCLAGKLPESLLCIPTLGCFNLHPSLLPVFRGPVPLFWQFREGIEEFGMTLHRMDSSFDEGPIIAQRILAMPNGITNQRASEMLAKAGSDLLEQYLGKIEQAECEEQTQNESKASYMSYPTDSDFTVSTTWTTRRMYNFICATQHWRKTYPCDIKGCVYQITEAISYQSTAESERVFSINNDVITIPCSDGIVTARFVPDIPLPIQG